MALVLVAFVVAVVVYVRYINPNSGLATKLNRVDGFLRDQYKTGRANLPSGVEKHVLVVEKRFSSIGKRVKALELRAQDWYLR